MLNDILRIIILVLVVKTGFSSTQFLTISDIHYGSNNPSGDGSDTNDNLLQLAMAKLSQLSKEVDFIINLGDLPTHGFHSADKKEKYEKMVFQQLYQADTEAKPMFYVAGNNDSLLGNYQPFSSNGRSPLNLAKDWQGACVHCKKLLIDSEHMYDGGYYSSYVIANNHEIMLIVLNSIQFTRSNSLLPYPNQKEDALKQLFWLEQQLSKHQAKQLLIAMHIPPGKSYQGNIYWQQPYFNQFLQILQENQFRYNQISLLTSHSHMDEIRKISLSPTQNIYAFSTPSISRIHYNNSAMKIFELDNDSTLNNFTTYYTPSDDQWANEHYTAIHSTGIFPECIGLNLANCLDSLNQDSICADIERGQYYGVKANVDNSVCRTIFQVN